MLQDSLDNARADFEASRAAGLLTEIGTMLQATEKNLETARSVLDRETVEDLERAIADAKQARDSSKDVKVLQAARDALERATMPLAAALMDSVAKTALAGKKLGDV